MTASWFYNFTYPYNFKFFKKIKKKYLIKCFKYVNTRLVDGTNNCSSCINYIIHSRITIAVAFESKPIVGSSMKIIDGLETSSTAIVSLLRYSFDRPLMPGTPTKASFTSSSMVSKTTFTNSCMTCHSSFHKILSQ